MRNHSVLVIQKLGYLDPLQGHIWRSIALSVNCNGLESRQNERRFRQVG